MDIDEDEVTREPFFDGGSDENEGEEQIAEDQADSSDADEQLVDPYIEDDDRSVSSVCSEDIEFAKSYNIQLQESKKKAAALYESEFIDSGGNDGFSDEAKSSSPKQSDREKLIATSVTSDCIHHRGIFLQTGDIVALCDQEDGQMYYAQLTGFVQDTYCEKSASVNWLVPIRSTSREVFNPADYRIGLEDTTLRRLDSMIFIRHSPSDYYPSSGCQRSDTQNKELDVDLRQYQKRGQPYIWTTMKPCRAPTIELMTQQAAKSDAQLPNT